MRFLCSIVVYISFYFITAANARFITPSNKVETSQGDSKKHPWQNTTQKEPEAKCRCFPGDECWPRESTWQEFNETIGGNLIATIPLGSPCHHPNYDAEQCEYLRSQWTWPEIHYKSPSSPMAPYFANHSCNPFSAPETPCEVGAYVQYSVKVSEPADVAKTIWFANHHNIRVVIRNSAHDYLGKSTGPGAIAIWVHNLKDTEILDYESDGYTGKAIKVGGGVQLGEAYKAAAAEGLIVVGGHCPSVAYAGGFTQGGGHSPLTSMYGLAADQVLEWEVVDGEGNVLRASREENSDLYWALSGGGGGTYGVVTSMTSIIYRDMPVTRASLSFAPANISQDQYLEAFSLFHKILPNIVDSGATCVNFAGATSFMLMVTAFDPTPDEITEMLSPLLTKLKELGQEYNYEAYRGDSFAEESTGDAPGAPVGTGQMGGYFVPRWVIEEKNDDLTEAIRFIFDNGSGVGNIAVNASRGLPADVYNSVTPRWREAIIMTALSTPYNFTAPLEEMEELQEKMTNVLVPALSKLAPDGGAYLNEADFRQPNFQDVFYGPTYDQLNKIKDKYDPFHTFFATTAVGSEYWVPQADGKLCKAK